MPPPDRFRYDGYTIDPADSVVVCRYATAAHVFTERFAFGPGGDWDDPAVVAAVRILYLLAGVSYYKTSAAPVIDLGELQTTAAERDFLRSFYVNGLGEFAYRNGLDLRGLRVEGPEAGAGGACGLRARTRTAPDPVRRWHRFHRDGGVARGGPPRRRAVRRRAAQPSASPPSRTPPPSPGCP